MRKFILIFGLFFLPLALTHAGDPLQKVAKEFGKKIRKLKNPRIGLLSFPYHNGKVSSGSSILSERLTTYMADIKGIRLVERNLLKKLLEEQHLSESGVVDAEAAQKIGKVLGVDVIITGTLNDLNEKQTELNARALKAGSGEIITASWVIVDRIWSDRPRSPKKPSYSNSSVSHEEEVKPVPNEAIEIGYPGGGRGGVRSSGGYYYGK